MQVESEKEGGTQGGVEGAPEAEDALLEKELERLTEEHEKRLWEAQKLVDRVNEGTVTELEVEEYMNRWKVYGF